MDAGIPGEFVAVHGQPLDALAGQFGQHQGRDRHAPDDVMHPQDVQGVPQLTDLDRPAARRDCSAAGRGRCSRALQAALLGAAGQLAPRGEPGRLQVRAVGDDHEEGSETFWESRSPATIQARG